MNESEQQQNVWPTESQPHAATPADALHTLLEFVIDNREGFRTWLNRRLNDNGSKLVLQMSDINEALVDLDDLLHVAMDRPRPTMKVLPVSPDVLKMVMERLAAIDTDGITVIEEDPDKNTGQYL